MKKLLLVAGVLSVSSVFGQQDDILDIEKYLQKKKSEEKNNIINPIPRILQTRPVYKNQNVFVLPNQDKVITLPQDNMPCVITDLTAFNMPNMFNPSSDLAALLKPGSRPGKMPNGAQRAVPFPLPVK